MDKFQNKYRIPSARAPFWDYGRNAAYFVTICTQNRICYFGDVLDGNMNLSEIGKIAHTCWFDISNHFPFVELGEFVIMPNHVHGIVIINKTDNDGNADNADNVETQNFASLQSPQSPQSPQSQPSTKNKFGPQSQNMASIIRGFKIGVTKNARTVHADFAWQSRFHDHIIRNNDEYQRITNYIIHNPSNWAVDKFHNP